MSPIGMIRNKITSAGAKGAEQIRAAAVRATARNGKEPYAYEEPSEDVLLMQENISERLREGEIPSSVLGSSLYLKKDARPPLFSVFVDVKEPDLRLFRSTLTSVLEQTYGEYELYIIDRGISDQVRDVVAWYREKRIHYLDISDGSGFAGIFNRAASEAAGDYILHLECGDLLTKDALFETALAIMQTDAEILYADEDRRDAKGRRFSDPYFKPDFSLDYLYAADYMSRIMVVRRSLFLALRFREEYEDAPEYVMCGRRADPCRSHWTQERGRWRIISACAVSRQVCGPPEAGISWRLNIFRIYSPPAGWSALWAERFSTRNTGS